MWRLYYWHKGCRKDYSSLCLTLTRWIPRKVLYWCVIQAWAYATIEKYGDKHPDDVTWSMVCKFLNSNG